MLRSDKEKLSWKEQFFKLKKKLTTRKGVIGLSIIFGLFLFILLIVKACEPAKGSPLYGVCGAFLEQQIAFPETIRQNYVEHYSNLGIRIYYSHIDGFGQYMTEFIECSFEDNPAKGMQLKGAVFNTIKPTTNKSPIKHKGHLYAVEQKYIDRFNDSYSINVIIDQEPDLTLPNNDPVFL